MTKLTPGQVRRLLSRRETPEPPEHLADRIKAEIPEALPASAAGLEPARTRTVPQSVGHRSLWLVAASLLVVIGAGFMVLRLVGPSESLSRKIALDGVTVIKDVVVIVPERSTVQPPTPTSAWRSAALSVPAAAQAKHPAAAPPSVRSAPRSAAEPFPRNPELDAAAETRATDSASESAGVSAQSGMPGAIAAGGEAPAANQARAHAAVGKMERVAAPSQATSGSIIVVLRDTAGHPVVGASLRLDRSDRPDVNCGSRTTGAGGAATFCKADPGAYRVCAQLPGFLPASANVVIAPGQQVTVPMTMARPPADGSEHPWTCPTPRPAPDQ
jgi:hypothetical protein